METLLPVIVGGLIGLAGGIVGPPLAHWLSEGSSNKKKRAEKLEEMIGHLYAHEHWLGVVRSIRVYGAQDNNEQSPLPKAKAIAAIYFPQFIPALAGLSVVSHRYEIWMLEGAKKRLTGNIKELNDGHREAYQAYLDNQEQFLSTLREFAASEFR
ncbi:hypothetical protein [Blastomonas sp. SL216]|uniref:hypothetical protein n=1 Tax=Blastomonas sp. SL216 TaxID=2995169 RepID=UPI00237733EA|nr:hypothetical protein OU999_09230 [Blastomonas sp. SL216]